jgi:hypothetical protein
VTKNYSYPGTFSDYSRQAILVSTILSAVLITIALLVLVFDTVFLGKSYLTMGHFVILSFLLIGSFLTLQLMARSLSYFHIKSNDTGLTVARRSSEIFIPYEKISGVDRIRIPGWWPLRADLKSRGETVRTMIRIRLHQGPPVTFVSGLTGEDDLIEKITRSAGLGETT